jgi:hypothetical protein
MAAVEEITEAEFEGPAGEVLPHEVALAVAAQLTERARAGELLQALR